MVYKLLIFDLDGTLINSLGDLTDAMNHALGQFGLETHTEQECKAMIGKGLRYFTSRAVGSENQQLVDEVMAAMKDFYVKNCTNKTYIYDGLVPVLAKFKEKRIKLAVATNKNIDMARHITDELFGKGYFDEVIGGSNGIPIKPQPEPVKELMQRLQALPDKTALIGDSEVDIQTAINCQIKSVGVTWGTRTRDELSASGADTIIDRPDELLGIF